MHSLDSTQGMGISAAIRSCIASTPGAAWAFVVRRFFCGGGIETAYFLFLLMRLVIHTITITIRECSVIVPELSVHVP